MFKRNKKLSGFNEFCNIITIITDSRILLQKFSKKTQHLFYSQTGNSISINKRLCSYTFNQTCCQEKETHADSSHVNMESSQLINQKRLSREQLQLRVQGPKYYRDIPHDNYQQSRCQYFTSVTTPTSVHFLPPAEYTEGISPQNHGAFELQPPNISSHHQNYRKFNQNDSNSVEVHIENHLDDQSVSKKRRIENL